MLPSRVRTSPSPVSPRAIDAQKHRCVRFSEQMPNGECTERHLQLLGQRAFHSGVLAEPTRYSGAFHVKVVDRASISDHAIHLGPGFCPTTRPRPTRSREVILHGTHRALTTHEFDIRRVHKLLTLPSGHQTTVGRPAAGPLRAADSPPSSLRACWGDAQLRLTPWISRCFELVPLTLSPNFCGGEVRLNLQCLVLGHPLMSCTCECTMALGS